MKQQRSSGGKKSVRGLLLLPELRRSTRRDTPKITKPVYQRSTPHADRPTTGPSATLSILKRLRDQVASGPRATILRAPLCHPGVTHIFGIGMAAVRHDEVTGVGPSKSKQPVPSTVY
jgi:hypothetical protein